MTKRTRRTHSPGFKAPGFKAPGLKAPGLKAKVALAAIKGEKTRAELAKLFAVAFGEI